MQAQKRKVFRIEQLERGHNGHAVTPNGHAEILAEIRELRTLVRPPEEITAHMIEAYRTEIAEAHKLKSELDLISAAINETKQEIATLHVTGFEGPEMKRVTHELDAVVGGTETATQSILSAAEFIDQCASTLAAALKDERDKGLVHDMQDKVVEIFEACNFQDLTGQRITKVVATLKFIETHIVRMMEIWGGIESFQELTPEAIAEREGDQALVNGPKLDGEVGHASQDDIDALFN
jgi:chemotaxis protein CheZ